MLDDERDRIITVTNILHKGDLPEDLDLGPLVAIDCETMGLNFNRDRLCLVQLSSGNGVAHMVQIEVEQNSAPNLCKLLSNEEILKIFHFARFDRLRFLAPVKSTDKIRGVFKLSKITEKGPDVIKLTWSTKVEIEGNAKPALLAIWIERQYF